MFGQVGPKVGSVDPGFGTAYLARVVREKKAPRDVVLVPAYTAAEALQMGLVNVVVPHEELDAEVARWCRELIERSPTAPSHRQAIVQCRYRVDPRQRRLGFQAVALFYQTEEHKEGSAAFREKRKPDFRRFVNGLNPCCCRANYRFGVTPAASRPQDRPANVVRAAMPPLASVKSSFN